MPLLTSSRPACTLSTIFAITLAYFRPFSPSNTTPEFRIILALLVPPRAMRRYPSTERWDVSVSSVFSSSGGTGMAVVVAIVLWLDEDGLACVGRGRVVFLGGLSALRIGISLSEVVEAQNWPWWFAERDWPIANILLLPLASPTWCLF